MDDWYATLAVRRALPAEVIADSYAPHPAEVLACGPAGSVIPFNASTWHGHTANMSGAPRRSLQVTFIPREGTPATDFPARMRPETLARVDEVALPHWCGGRHQRTAGLTYG